MIRVCVVWATRNILNELKGIFAPGGLIAGTIEGANIDE
jgi:hypothetical protein